MGESLMLHNATPEELVNKINEGIKEQLATFKKELQAKEVSDEIMSRSEVCEFLQIDPSTLWGWVNKGKIKSYGIANRRYYKRSEILESLILIKK